MVKSCRMIHNQTSELVVRHPNPCQTSPATMSPSKLVVEGYKVRKPPYQ